MNKATHKATIDALKALQDNGIAEKIVARMDFRAALSNDSAKRALYRKMLLATFLKESNAYFSGVSKLGADFARVKLGH